MLQVRVKFLSKDVIVDVRYVSFHEKIRLVTWLY